MQANYVQRLRLLFSKTGPTRFIGHLDLARTLERAFNRAKLPISYTQGFNQRPRMQLAIPLPLGYTSECEWVDIWLSEKMDTEIAHHQMGLRMAPGITLLKVVEVPLSAPALQTQTIEATYRVTLLEEISRTELSERVRLLLGATELIRERREKAYDLRPLILELQVQQAEDGAMILWMRLLLLPSQTGRPEEVLSELGLDALSARVHRVAISFKEDAGT